MTFYDLAIIGSGFCGSMIASNVICLNPTIKIALIENRAVHGKGLAYGTSDIDHLLNVRAGNMGAFADDPEHFWRWLDENKTSLYAKYDFVPRKIYGEYLSDILEQACATGAHLNLLNQRIVDLKPTPSGFELMAEDGSHIMARKVVLALGNFPPDTQDPYAPYLWQDIADDGDVLIVGTGLTSLDLVVTLAKTKARGTIHLLSRHGLLPREHSETVPYQLTFDLKEASTTVLALYRAVLQEIVLAAKKGISWHSVIDALRPYNQIIWQRLPLNEKRRFQRHVRIYWDIHRHRCAPIIMDTYRDLVQKGRLILHHGSILSQKASDKGWDVKWRERGTTGTRILQVQYLLRCTGPQADFRKIDDRLVENMFKRLLIAADALNLGIVTADDFTIIDANEQRVENLYALGSVLKGRLYESVAVPELREQAAAIAINIVHK